MFQGLGLENLGQGLGFETLRRFETLKTGFRISGVRIRG